MAYVIIVEFRAKPDQIEAFAELIDRHAHNSRRLRTAASRSTSARTRKILARFVFYEAYRDEAAHRRHLEMASYRWFRATAPDLSCPAPRARCRTPPGADPPPVPFRVA